MSFFTQFRELQEWGYYYYHLDSMMGIPRLPIQWFTVCKSESYGGPEVQSRFAFAICLSPSLFGIFLSWLRFIRSSFVVAGFSFPILHSRLPVSFAVCRSRFMAAGFSFAVHSSRFLVCHSQLLVSCSPLAGYDNRSPTHDKNCMSTC